MMCTLIYIVCDVDSSIGSSIIAIHSQSADVPKCPNGPKGEKGEKPLWEGYSLLHTENDANTAPQDLGKLMYLYH